MEYRVIKENDLFLLTDLSGDITEAGSERGHGLYTKDTRFLSRLELKVNGSRLDWLSSEADENYVANIVLTNPSAKLSGKVKLWPQSLEVKRNRFIYQGVLYETLTVTSFHPQPTEFELSLTMDADFRDMFVVRGFQNGKVGEKKGASRHADGLALSYEGKDGVIRKLEVAWGTVPSDAAVTDAGAELTYRMALNAGESRTIELLMTPVIGEDKPKRFARETAVRELKSSYAEWEHASTAVESDHSLFNRLYQRGLLDIRVLLTDLGFGPFPVAGLPWFAVPFGRDSLIAALQMLPVNPEVAKGTIRTMAHFQGEKHDPWRDEQPGKIMHELREGELANTGKSRSPLTTAASTPPRCFCCCLPNTSNGRMTWRFWTR